MGAGRRPRQFDRQQQGNTHGPIFQRLRDILDRPNPALQLRADPASLAPERLLVLEVTGTVVNFANAVLQIPGLEFAGEEELQPDDFDVSPEFYLLIPQLAALEQIVSLWERWRRDGALPRGYTPWRDLFLQLRAVRPWGPVDRVSPANRQYFLHIIEDEPDDFLIRIEIELAFRPGVPTATEAVEDITRRVVGIGGRVINEARRPEFAYHALLVEVPATEIRGIAALDRRSLAGADPIASIVPQSIGTGIDAGDRVPIGAVPPPPENHDPVVALFDAVPLQAHPLLADRLTMEDPDELEARAVGQRVHGTAMASLVLHGDLNAPPPSIRRKVYFRPVMYAPAFGDECFDNDKLVIDVIVEAVIRMREGEGPNVVVVNLSLGDTNKPFTGKISTWARALDYLAFTYGILFLVSAGNIPTGIVLADIADEAAFRDVTLADRANKIFKGLDAAKADRRLLAPADSVNCLTIGSWYRDAVQEDFRSDRLLKPYDEQQLPNVSSRLGPGLRRGTKPDILLPGGRQRIRVEPETTPVVVRPHALPSKSWGLKVAAPLENGEMGLHFTLGTSAATALASNTAHRVFDALDAAYPQLIVPMPLKERAALIKALLVHAASWRDSEIFIRSIIDPTAGLHHESWRREVCRHLGYGFVDPDDAVGCVGDRATMWATGTLEPEGSLTFDVPLPALLAARASEREVRATLAWLTPIRAGHLAYRALKLKIASLNAESMQIAGIGTTSSQPSNTQAESGTIIHRRWRNARIGEARDGATLPVQIQRERDQGTPIDEATPFGLAVTIAMPGELEIYDQVKARIDIQPAIEVRVQS